MQVNAGTLHAGSRRPHDVPSAARFMMCNESGKLCKVCGANQSADPKALASRPPPTSNAGNRAPGAPLVDAAFRPAHLAQLAAPPFCRASPPRRHTSLRATSTGGVCVANAQLRLAELVARSEVWRLGGLAMPGQN